MNTTPVILNYGLGMDSTAILLHWLEEPESRDFDLNDVITKVGKRMTLAA